VPAFQSLLKSLSRVVSKLKVRAVTVGKELAVPQKPEGMGQAEM